MNIFITDPDPVKSAQALDDKRVVKMVLESAQMLSSAVFINSNETPEGIYRPTHLKHPCTVWVSQTQGNYQWLLDHMQALSDEYTFRYDKTHKSSRLIPTFSEMKSDFIPKGECQPFANCARARALGLDFTEVEDVCEAYRSYLNAKWRVDTRKPTWKKRGQPMWADIEMMTL